VWSDGKFWATNGTVWTLEGLLGGRVMRATARMRPPHATKRNSKAKKTRRTLFTMTADVVEWCQ
jgi:hypothetical protein